MTLRRQPQPFQPMQPLNLAHPVIVIEHQVRRRAASLPPRRRPIIQHDHPFPLPCQKIRRRQPRDPRPHDAHVRLNIFLKRPRLRHIRRGHPHRNTAAIIGFHPTPVTQPCARREPSICPHFRLSPPAPAHPATDSTTQPPAPPHTAPPAPKHKAAPPPSSTPTASQT